MLRHMKQRGISEQDIAFIKYCGFDVQEWLTGFSCVMESVQKSVELVRTHPLIPNDVVVEGFLMDPATGRIDRLEDVLSEACMIAEKAEAEANEK